VEVQLYSCKFSCLHRFYIEQQQQQHNKIPRPKDYRKRKAYCSDNKKRYAEKTQIMVNKKGIIIHKTAHKKGSSYDYDFYKENCPVNPKEVVNLFDLGYLGAEKDFPQQLSSLQYRKKRNLEI
jgi:hypothetical protein